ncbi:MAG: ribosome biogenesis protein [Nitrososphaerales archaeon]
MLALIIAEASLETVPKEIAKHVSVVKHAFRKGKSVQEVLLDRSYHHAAMLKLPNGSRRGRPDLVHFALLEATATPLYRKGMLEIYVHTIGDKVIFLYDSVRLPKSYFRFEALMEGLFREKQVRSNDKLLMEVKNMSFVDLLKIIKKARVVGLSRTGLKSSSEEVAINLDDNSALVVGGFPRGHFSSKIYNGLDLVYSIGDYSLEAHVVIARLLYEYEKKLKL